VVKVAALYVKLADAVGFSITRTLGVKFKVAQRASLQSRIEMG